MRTPRSFFSANVSSGSPPRSSLRGAPHRARVPDADLPTIPRRNVPSQRVAWPTGHTERPAPYCPVSTEQRPAQKHACPWAWTLRRAETPPPTCWEFPGPPRPCCCTSSTPRGAEQERNHCLAWVRRQQRDSSVFQGWSELEPNYRSYQRSKTTSSR